MAFAQHPVHRVLVLGAILLLATARAQAWSVDVEAAPVPDPAPQCPVSYQECALGTFILTGSSVPPQPSEHGIAIAATASASPDPDDNDRTMRDAVAFRIDNDGQLRWQARKHARRADTYRFARNLPDGGMLAVGIASDGFHVDGTLMLTRFDADGGTRWHSVGVPAVAQLQTIIDVKLLGTDGDALVVLASGGYTGYTSIIVTRVNGDGSIAWTQPGTPLAGQFPVASTLLPDGTLIVQSMVILVPGSPYPPDRYLAFRSSDGALLWDVPIVRDEEAIDSNTLGLLPDGRLLVATHRNDEAGLAFGLASLDASGVPELHGVVTLPVGSTLDSTTLLDNGDVLLLRRDAGEAAPYSLGTWRIADASPTWQPVAVPAVHDYATLYDDGVDAGLLTYHEDGDNTRFEVRGLASDARVRWLQVFDADSPQVGSTRLVFGSRDLTFVQNVAAGGNVQRVRIRVTRVGVPVHRDDFE